MQDSEIQTQLWNRLREVKVDIGRKEEATELVKLAEEDNTETNYNRALESINRLRDNELKKDLLNRLNNVKSNIDNNNAKKEEANKLVAQAEKDNKEETYNKALTAVKALEDSQAKKDLLNRLNSVKVNIDKIKTNEAIRLVEYAEKYPSISTYNNAKIQLIL